MVVTRAPAAAPTGYTQERTAAPFTCTVQAPQAAIPQPNFVPVMPASSRMAHNRGIWGSASSAVGFPLRLGWTGIVFPSGCGVAGIVVQDGAPKVAEDAKPACLLAPRRVLRAH